MDDPDWEQALIEAMPFLVAPDQIYREATGLIVLTELTPRLIECAEAWRSVYSRSKRAKESA